MDQTLWAILIGAGVSIVTTLISQWFIVAKEKRQWVRERQSRLEDQKSIETKEKRELIREAYSHSIEAASALLTFLNSSGATKEKYEFYIGELNKWLAELILVSADQIKENQNERLLQYYDNVANKLEPTYLRPLRKHLIDMSLTDKRI